MKTPTLKPFFEAHAAEYPTLYGTDHRAWLRAMIRTLTTNGNGWDWKNGEYQDMCRDSWTSPELPKDLQKMADDHHLEQIMTQEINDLCPQFSAQYLPGEWCGLYHTPDTVTDEWLEVVEYILEYIFQASSFHFYFYRDGTNSKFEPVRMYTRHAECAVKHDYWNTYQVLKERIPRIKEIEEPRNCYNPYNTKEERKRMDALADEIIQEVLNEEWVNATGEERYEDDSSESSSTTS